MKKLFVEPKIKIVELDATAIIAESGNNGTGGNIPDAPFE